MEFSISNYDMLYPIEYIDEETIDYTDMLIEAYTLEPKELFEQGIKMAELPYVIKNPENKDMKSYLENEIRSLNNPFEEKTFNLGRVYPGVKNDNTYKGRGISYNKCGLRLERIVIGNKCDERVVFEMKNMNRNLKIL